ncbi:MAG: M50 family metallopeptidase, partial [Planctomycetes bacterium]|nr:M50 family metallopeptidase [Planctomycetota bacterium]
MLNFLQASHNIGRYFGIEVRITYLLYLVVAFFTLTDLADSGVRGGLLTMVSFLCLIGFVYLHEMGHSLAAIKEGVGVQAIYLHPLGGLAQLVGIIPGPMGEITIALAGPFVSLLLAAIFFLPMYLVH